MNLYLIINCLGALLIITSLMVVLEKSPKRAALTYGAQAAVLIGCFVALGMATGNSELFTWAGTAVFTKVLLVPGIILFTLKKMGPIEGEAPSVLNPQVFVLLACAEVAICFALVSQIELPTAAEVTPALAISLAHFFIGLSCIVTQRSIIKQVFGYCLMENGSHLTLALLAPEAPELLEIGISTDAIFAVIIMAVLVYRIHKIVGTTDADELNQLKG